MDLTWSMCVQDPPMVFIDKLDRGADFNNDYFRKFTRAGGSKFDYLVWPAILLHQNGPLVVKGIAEPIKIVKRGTPNSVAEQPKPAVEEVVTPPRDRNSPVGKSRNPEDWVDLDMNSEDNNSWDRDPPQTPKKVYKKATTHEGVPNSPYFAPYSNRELNQSSDIPQIRIQNSEDAARGRYTRSQDGRLTENQAGNLTVLWKNKQTAPHDRRTSAP